MLALFVALVALTIIQAANLLFLNKMQERKRVANGKPAKIIDKSMINHYEQTDSDMEVNEQAQLGQQALLDLSDRKNDEFVYLY